MATNVLTYTFSAILNLTQVHACMTVHMNEHNFMITMFIVSEIFLRSVELDLQVGVRSDSGKVSIIF